MELITRLYILPASAFLLASNLHAAELSITKQSAMPLVQALHYKQRLINDPQSILKDSKEQSPKKNPFSRVSECSGTCALSRATPEDMQARNHFENHIATSLKSKNNPLLLSIGSGYLFSEARIAALAHQGDAESMELHVIDPLYTKFIDAVQVTKSPDRMFTIGKDTINTSNDGDVSFYAELFRQFAGFISGLYEGNVRIFIYPHVTDYPAKDLKVAPKPDLVIACDPEFMALNTFNKDVEALLNTAFHSTCEGIFLYNRAQLIIIEPANNAPISKGIVRWSKPSKFNKIPTITSIINPQGNSLQ